MPEQPPNGKQQEMTNLHNQKHNNKALTKKISKLLILFSILIPLLIMGLTFFNQQQQLIYKTLGINSNDLQLAQTINRSIATLSSKIEKNKLQIKEHFLLKDHHQLQRQLFGDIPKNNNNNPLEVYDTLAYNIVLFNINKNQPPLDQSLREKLESSMINKLQQRSYLGKYVDQSSLMNNKDKDQQFNAFNLKLKLKISVQSGHISQIEQNYQSKIVSFYQQQLSSQHDEVSSILNILQHQQQNGHKNYCQYLRLTPTCKQHTIYMLYRSNNNNSNNNSNNNNNNNHNHNNNSNNNNNNNQDNNNSIMQPHQVITPSSYWSTQQDYTVSVMVLQQQQQQLSSHHYYFRSSQFFTTKVQQIIYQSLNLSEIILLLHINNNLGDQQSSRTNSQLIIDKYVQMKLMEKQLNTLKRSIYQQQMPFNHIDTFPSQYKLGALAPLAIILIYPLFTSIRYLFQ